LLSLIALLVVASHAFVPHHGDAPQYATLEDPTWDVTFVSGNLDTVIVDLRIVGSHPELSQCYKLNAPSCSFQRMHWVITPCPLVFYGFFGDTCPNGTFDNSTFLSANMPVRLALRTGITYTFAGDVTFEGVSYGHEGGCDPFTRCTFREEPAPRVYYAAPVATKPITWGAVKSMYRQ
jgi:hypothetical protein